MKRHLQKGVTLIEMMVSLVIGLIISGSILNIYINNKNNYNYQSGLSTVQETMRFAGYVLSRDIRMAGYQGCVSIENLALNNVVKNPTTDMILDNSKSIYGYTSASGTWSPALPSSVPANLIRSNTDVLVVRNASPTAVQVRNSMAQPTSAIVVYDRSQIDQDDILIISDCVNADMFAAGGNSNASSISHGSNNNISPSLSKAYGVDAQVMQFSSHTYFVGTTGRTNQAGDPIYALYQVDAAGNRIEIAEGVENMKVLYGVDTNDDGSADTYSSASSVEAANQWADVKSVRVELLINSVENMAHKPMAYTFDGTTTTPTDRQIRRSWSINITLRNRAL